MFRKKISALPLRQRLLINTLVPLLVTLPVVAIVLVYLMQTQVQLANIASELTRQAVLVADFAALRTEIWQNPEQAKEFIARISPSVPAEVMLLDEEGRLIVSSDPGNSFLVGKIYTVPDVNRLLASNNRAEVKYSGRTIEDIIVPVITPARDLIGYVRFSNPLAQLYQRSEVLSRATIFVVGGGLLVGILLALLLANELERPLKNTTDAAYQFASGEKLSPLPEEGPKEVRTLVRAFNILFERLQTLESSRRRLLSNLVHELGTPLGALRSATQALIGGAKNQPELRDELLNGMDQELVHLQHLTEELAHLHDQVLGSLDLRKQEIQTTEWLNRTLAAWGEAAQQKKLTWSSSIPAGLPPLYADPERLSQALGNLVSNAIRYTPSGGEISVTAQAVDKTLTIQVKDTGPGIAADEVESIFKPFARGRASTRFAEGMGLGLSIARDLARAHNGDILVSSKPGNGSQFTLQIPLQPNPSE